MVVLDSFQSARTDRKAAPRPTVRAALLVAPLLLLDFRGFAPNNTTKNQNFYLHAIRKRRLGKAPPFVGRFFIGFGRSDRKMCKKTQIFQISSKFHRLNRRKDGIFSCMRSARVDWGKSHRQITYFSRGLGVPSENMHFHHPKPYKNQTFQFFSNFSTRASSLTSAKLSKRCKISVFARSLLFGRQLRVTAAQSIPASENECLKFSKHITKKCNEL